MSELSARATVEPAAADAKAEPAEVEEQHPTKAEDAAFVREFVPKAAILSLTALNVTVLIIRTPYSRVQLRVLYTARYPHEAPLVELSSPTLPQALLRNKEKECLAVCKEHEGKAQVAVVFEVVHRFIQTNLFVPCWKEMKMVLALCEGKGQLGADEKEGVLHMRLRVGEYRQSIKIRVPPAYPVEGVVLEFCSSNFPPDIVFAFQAQACEIVRRCVAGFSPEAAIGGSNPIELPGAASSCSVVGKKKSDDISARALTSGNLKALKHDVEVLKQISDLRVASTQDKKYVYSVQATAERREARKDLRRLARAESERDVEEEKQVREQEQAEMVALLKLKISDTAQSSLFVVSRFLVEEYAARLPHEKCLSCNEHVLHQSNPADPTMTNPKSPRRPVRVFCGHWLHWGCLNTWLTTPPFIRQCPVCTPSRRIWHPDWPADVKNTEKAFQMAQERQRELNDCAGMMGF